MAASSSQTALRGSDSFMVSASSAGQAASLGTSQLLAKLRKDGNNKLCDIELVVEGRKEYVHSAVVAVHSKLFYRLINTEQSPPFSYDLHHFSYDSIRSVIDWMYFGEAKFSSDICSHLAVAAYFEVAALHSLLEQQLIRLAMNTPTIPAALEACANEKTKVSSATATLVVDCLLSASFPKPPLTTRTAKFLLARDEANLKRTAAVISLVLKWLALHRDQAVAVLEHVQHVQLSEADERALITRLVCMVLAKEEVHVDVVKNRLHVFLGPVGGPRSEQLVSRGSFASPAQSEMELYQHMAYSPVNNMQRELAKLPDVFGQARPQTKTDRTASYPEYLARPPGFIPPSFGGHVDMPISDVQLSTTSTPAFAAVTTAAPPLAPPTSGRSAIRTCASNTNTYSYNEPIAAPFTAESIAEITALPDQFGRKPASNYGTPQQQYATPSRNVSSVYAQPAPYGPSYTEGAPVPYSQKSQQQLPAPIVSQPGPVKLELLGGAVVIPHAAHPMLPFSQPYVEVRLPAQPSYPANFSEYNTSRFKTSEYAGML